MKKIFLACLFALACNPPLAWGAGAAATAAPPADGDRRAEERFRSMDTDASGLVGFEEFQKRYPHMQRPAFDAIDLGGDGNISLEEWRSFFQGHGSGAMPPGGMGAMPPGGTPPAVQGGKPLILPPAKSGR